MATRPEMLSDQVFRESLREQGCNPKYVDACLNVLRYVSGYVCSQVLEF
jgi:hypothetical protein